MTNNILTGVPPREPIAVLRPETNVHRVLMPVIMAAILPKVAYTYGSDVSKWNGIMNWAQNYAAGGRFTFMRLGSISPDGVLYLDYQWERNSEIAPEYMFSGGYWFFRPEHSPIKQADFVAEHIAGKDLKLPFVLDCEVNTTHMSATYVEKNIKLFLERHHNNTGKWPMIYTSKGFWSYPNIYASANIPDWAAERDLWVANYTLASSPAMPVTWSAKGYKFWQYSADGNQVGPEWGGEWQAGAPKPSMDLNRFPGDYYALEQYVAEYNDGVVVPPIPQPPPDPEPPIELETKIITTTGVNLRTDSYVSSKTFLCTMPTGTILEKIGEKDEWVEVRCYVHGDYVQDL